MKKINPLYIVALLLITLGFGVFKLSQNKSALQEEQQAYAKTLELATKLKAYKEIYDKQEMAKRSLDGILKQNLLADAKIVRSDKGTQTTLSSDAIELRALDFLTGKLLNATYEIKKLKIERIDETKARFSMEIAW
ncbi:MAG: hypothetical protein IE916_02380 [Epsilonproteobacteria bacterium]|nr:hypothetical protein [Campylobacterota bacterium]